MQADAAGENPRVSDACVTLCAGSGHSHPSARTNLDAAPSGIEALANALHYVQIIFLRFGLNMIVFAAAIWLLVLSGQTLAETISISTSWSGVKPCTSLSRSPPMTIKGFPKNAKRVMLILTQGDNKRGGQEVDLPASGKIPEGAAVTLGPCNPGIYRWTAVFKTDKGEIVGQAHIDRPYP